MSEKIRFGLIGLGTMGLIYARLAEQNPSVELVALCDRDKTVLSSTEKEFPNTSKYTDIESMILKSDLNAVGIITPDFAHFDPVKVCCQAGVNLLIEKPLATNVAEAESMVTEIQKAGILCQLAYTNRWNPPYVTAKNLISSGQLGEVSSLNARINNSISTPTEMLGWAEKSSPAWFLMTHALDISRYLSEDEPIEVFARGVKKKLVSMGINVFDTVHAVFQLSSGASLFIESSWILPNGMPLNFDFKYEIIGTDSTLMIDTHDQGLHLATPEKLNHPVSLFIKRYGKYTGHLQAMIDSFFHSILRNEKPIVNEMDGLLAVLAIDAVHRSIDSGRPEKISL